MGWVFWVLAAIVLAVGEMLTLSFFLAPFAGGAAAGRAGAAWAAAARCCPGACSSSPRCCCCWSCGPIARSHRRTPAALRTGTAALIGRRAVVVERIAND